MRNAWLLLSLAACATTSTQAPDLADSEQRIAESTPQAFGVLALLNSRETTLSLLDDDIGLDSRAARALIEHRDGPDGQVGTSDDDLYDTIAEVDEQYYVGDAALAALLDYASDDGWIPGPNDVVGSWEGVPFTSSQVTSVLDLVNTASQTELDDDVGLDRRAAEGIVAARPLLDLNQLGGVPWVGPSALRALQDYAALAELAQVNEDCSTDADCADDLRCMGSIAYGSGIMCVDTWGVFSWSGPESIPDDGSELVTSVDVQGLASVPVDVVLTIDVDHARPSDLVLSIDNFNGYGTTLWEGDSDTVELEMVVYAFPSDDMVHGLYNVRLTDTVPGVQGTLRGWDLLVVSTYD